MNKFSEIMLFNNTQAFGFILVPQSSLFFLMSEQDLTYGRSLWYNWKLERKDFIPLLLLLLSPEWIRFFFNQTVDLVHTVKLASDVWNLCLASWTTCCPCVYWWSSHSEKNIQFADLVTTNINSELYPLSDTCSSSAILNFTGVSAVSLYVSICVVNISLPFTITGASNI